MPAYVYVGHIPLHADWRFLKDIFRNQGIAVRKADVALDFHGQSRGYGIVEVDDPEDIDLAIDRLNRTEVEGQLLVVREDREPNIRPEITGKGKGKIEGKGESKGKKGVPRRALVGAPPSSRGESHSTWSPSERKLLRTKHMEDQPVQDEDVSAKLPPWKVDAARKRTVERPVEEDGRSRRTVAPTENSRYGGHGDEAEVAQRRLFCEGLAPSVTWKTLKDFFRSFVVPAYTSVEHLDDGAKCGVVEFSTRADALEACMQFNGCLLDGEPVRLRQDRGEFKELRTLKRQRDHGEPCEEYSQTERPVQDDHVDEFSEPTLKRRRARPVPKVTARPLRQGTGTGFEARDEEVEVAREREEEAHYKDPEFPCPACGYINAAGAAQCAECGVRLDEDGSDAEPEPRSPQSEAFEQETDLIQDGDLREDVQADEVFEQETDLIQGDDFLEDVQAFIEDHNFDDRAVEALTTATPEVQQAVLSQGNLRNRENQSSALMGRIRDAQASKWNSRSKEHGKSGGKGKGGRATGEDELCRYWKRLGWCRLEGSCNFSHPGYKRR
mmetsp:Transcript_27990/g.43648  ORF Transcript_27990/g.43648 Transcript_27990/m.43648 type:complete len:554 (-) Transcript_27990:71-1732(-)